MMYHTVMELSKDGKLNAELNEIGEPTIESLVNDPIFQTLVGTKEELKKLSEELGATDNGKPNRLAPDRALVWAEYVSKENPTLSPVLTEKVSMDAIEYELLIEPRNPKLEAKLKVQKAAHELTTRLHKKLEEWGVSVGTLQETELNQGKRGVTEFERPVRTANGMIEMIRIAKGEEGDKALAEEFSHLAFEIAIAQNSAIAERMLKQLNNEVVLKEILGDAYTDYLEEYNGDMNRMAREAAGKLMKDCLINGKSNPTKMPIIDRFIAAIKEWLGLQSTDDLQRIIDLCKDSAQTLVIESFEREGKQDFSKVLGQNKNLFDIEASQEACRDALINAVKNESKRLAILSSKISDGHITQSDRDRISDLNDQITTEAYEVGISRVLTQSVKTLTDSMAVIGQIKHGTYKFQNDTKAKMTEMRKLRINMQAYENLLQFIDTQLLDSLEDNEINNRIKEDINSLRIMLAEAKSAYNRERVGLVREYITKVLPETFSSQFGEDKQTTIDELLECAENDISWMDQWLDSMGESSNVILQGLDQSVKVCKEMARQDTLDLSHRLKALGLRLEKAGIKGTDWMCERDENGQLTMNFITQFDMLKYRKEKREMYKELIAKYGAHPRGITKSKFDREVRAWKKAHPIENYKSAKYEALSPLQKEVLNEFLAIKKSLDELYGGKITREDAIPVVHKDTVERIKDAGPTGLASVLKEEIKDKFIVREDEYSKVSNRETEAEESTGDAELDAMLAEEEDEKVKTMLLDFDNSSPIRRLPVYYSKLPKGGDRSDVSTDMLSAMIMYAAKAHEYKNMRDNLDSLEETIAWVKEGLGVKQKSGGFTIKNEARIMGSTVADDAKLYGQTRIAKKTEEWRLSQIYGQKEAEEMLTDNISGAKLADTANWIQSLSSLGFNSLSGFANVATGAVMTTIEAFAGEFFSFGDLSRAEATVDSNMLGIAADCGARVKTNKVSLFMEKFNILQEYEKEVKEVDWKTRTRFGRLFGSSLIFGLQNMGEYVLQSRSGIAMANHVKLRDANGKKISLWDALEVKYFDAQGNLTTTDQGYGAQLDFKEGVTKLDGSEFGMNDIIAFTNKAKAVNQRMHGIYNEVDRCNAQHYAVGRLGIMFKKWIKISMNKRWAAQNYNADLGQETEGYYRTCGRLIKQMIIELRAGQFKWSAFSEHLKPAEIANIRRALAETAIFVASAILANGIDWPDDKDKNRGIAWLEYQARRLYSELGVLSIDPAAWVTEGEKLIKNPIAVMNLFEKLAKIFKVIEPASYEVYQSGPHKGEVKMGVWLENIFPFSGVGDQVDLDALVNKTKFLKSGN